MKLSLKIIIAFCFLGISASMAQAAKTCGSNMIRTCAGSIKELEIFQAKNRESLDMQNIILKDELFNFAKSFNGRPLVYPSLLGEYVLIVKISDKLVKVDFNGTDIEDAKLCVQVCVDDRSLTWYHPKFGTFTKIQDGLRVGKYDFKLQN